jgi:hypothetical protein
VLQKPTKNYRKSEQFQCFSFTGEFSPNFDLPTGFFMEKNITQIRQIFKNSFSYRQIFYEKFQQCFFYWRVFAKFRPEKIGLPPDFSWKRNDPHSPDFEELVF